MRGKHWDDIFVEVLDSLVARQGNANEASTEKRSGTIWPKIAIESRG